MTKGELPLQVDLMETQQLRQPLQFVLKKY